jgi:predicted  nucleic acid-binding Zn-ribbon protein
MKYFIFLLCLFPFVLQAQPQPQPEEQVNQQYESVKLELLCRTVQFILKENRAGQVAEQVRCNSLEALGQSIPKEHKQASSIFNLFRNKHYNSFGKGKLKERLDKFLKDLNSEVTKLNRDRTWQNNVLTLQTQLDELRKQSLQQIQDGSYQTPESTPLDTLADRVAQPKPITTQPPTVAQNTPETKSASTGIGYVVLFLILLFLLAGGGGYFLYWKIQELKKELAEKEERLNERFNHIESQFPLFTPLREYQSLPPQIGFLNDQLTALTQEVVVLKTRNEFKPTMDELYAQRTEHLEGIRYNPNIRMHYIKYRPDVNGFNPQEFKNEPSRDSIFKFEISAENPHQATFSIVSRNEYHSVAIANTDLMLDGACEYANPPYNDTRIVTHENGIAEKRGDIWVVLKKAIISFE